MLYIFEQYLRERNKFQIKEKSLEKISLHKTECERVCEIFRNLFSVFLSLLKSGGEGEVGVMYFINKILSATLQNKPAACNQAFQKQPLAGRASDEEPPCRRLQRLTGSEVAGRPRELRGEVSHRQQFRTNQKSEAGYVSTSLPPGPARVKLANQVIKMSTNQAARNATEQAPVKPSRSEAEYPDNLAAVKPVLLSVAKKPDLSTAVQPSNPSDTSAEMPANLAAVKPTVPAAVKPTNTANSLAVNPPYSAAVKPANALPVTPADTAAVSSQHSHLSMQGQKLGRRDPELTCSTSTTELPDRTRPAELFCRTRPVGITYQTCSAANLPYRTSPAEPPFQTCSVAELPCRASPAEPPLQTSSVAVLPCRTSPADTKIIAPSGEPGAIQKDGSKSAGARNMLPPSSSAASLQGKFDGQQQRRRRRPGSPAAAATFGDLDAASAFQPTFRADKNVQVGRLLTVEYSDVCTVRV